MKGDLLVIAAATLYAVINTSEVSKSLITYSKWILSVVGISCFFVIGVLCEDCRQN